MIEKIILKIDKKEIELTIEQAKELKEELDKLFGKTKYIPYPIYPSDIWTYIHDTVDPSPGLYRITV